MRLPSQGCFAPQSRLALDRANRYMITISQAGMNICVITHNILQLQALSDELFLLNSPTASSVHSLDICILFRFSEAPVRLIILLFLSQLFFISQSHKKMSYHSIYFVCSQMRGRSFFRDDQIVTKENTASLHILYS